MTETFDGLTGVAAWRDRIARDDEAIRSDRDAAMTGER